jgi:predicted LPLAT superfamily acyltransferase
MCAEKRRRWTSRSIGSPLQHLFFYKLIQMGGRRLAYVFVYPVVLYYVLCRKVARQRSEPYLSRRFPGQSRRERFLSTFRLVLNLAKVLVDRAVTGIVGPGSIEVIFHGREELFTLKEQGGFILLMSHVGGWQVAMSSIGNLGVPVSMLLQREPGDVDRHFFEHANIPCPYEIIDPAGYLGGALEIVRVLDQGEILCLMGDRVFGSDKHFIATEFLGEKGWFPISAYTIAAATGVPVVVLFSHKSGGRSYTLEVARIIRPSQGVKRRGRDAEACLREYVDTLERYTEQHPDQFFNFFDMWKRP